MKATPLLAWPEVSIVMSCYNASRWLSRAIESVLRQSFASFELIVIDNGSTDGTPAIIKRFEEHDERVVGVTKTHSVLAESLNVGIDRARGSWIARLDADDMCESNRIERQVAFLKDHHGLSLLGSGFVEIDENGRVLKTHRYPRGHSGLVRHLERSQRFFHHSSAMYPADAVRMVGRYRAQFRRSEDMDLWLRLASVGRIACIREPLVRVRKHRAQMSLDSSGRPQRIDATAATVCHFLRRGGHQDPADALDPAEWNDFLQWIGARLEDADVFERRSAWEYARSRFFRADNRLVGGMCFGREFLRSGYGYELVVEKVFGSDLPRRLANEWVAQSSGA